MKKRLSGLMIATAAILALVGCNPSGSSAVASSVTGSSAPTSSVPASSAPISSKTSSSAPASSVIKVDSVTITGGEQTTVYDGSTVTLKATVNSSTTGLKVTWSSSDETIAKVTNGVVRFEKVTAETTVTITATSKDDTTKKASVTFTVKHSLIDLSASRGNNLDDSNYLSEGSLTADPGDVAFVYADVHSTKWYVQADITIDSLLDTDNYPKFGIMTGNHAGYWNNSTEGDTAKNAFFYVDSMQSTKNAGWTNFNFVPQNDSHTDWNWGGQLAPFSVSTEDKVAMSTVFTMGLLRNGVDYYLYVSKTVDGAKTVAAYKHITYADIAADEDSYAWIGGWSVGVTCSNFKALTGDAVDAMFETPTTLTLAKDAETLYLGDTYQIVATTDKLVAPVSYSSSDTSIATVSATGLVTANATTAGTATITVTSGTLTAKCEITVTDDKNYSVVLDGKMDDTIYNTAVKTNKFTLKCNDTNYLDIYGGRNSRGVYLYVEQHVSAIRGPADNWWENDNFEIRLGDVKNPNGEPLGQLWVNAKGDGNFDGHYASTETQNTTTTLYDVNYEVFESYDKIGVSKDDIVCMRIGSNMNAGWTAYDFDDCTFDRMLKITNQGIFADLPTDNQTCTAKGHTYGEWYETTAATTTAKGVKTHKCIYCGKEETEEEAMLTYDPAAVVVDTASTCHTKGTGHVVDTTGATITVELPLDPTNHDAWDDTKGYCTSCGETIKKDAAITNTGSGWNSAVKSLKMDGTKDWTLSFTLTNTTLTTTETDNRDIWVGEVFSDSWSNGGWSFRGDFDGWGAWTDNNHRFSTYDYSAWNNVFRDASRDMSVTFTLTYTIADNTIVMDAAYTSKVEGYVGRTAYMKHWCDNVTYRGNMNINVGRKDSTVVISSAKYVKGDIAA
jgi:uncharacterized protein YjdB